MIDVNKVEDIEFDGIDHTDFPRFCDAYICDGIIDDKHLTEEEMDWIMENERDWFYEQLNNHLF